MFAGFKCQTFMPHILQSDYFLAYFFLRQFLAGDCFVFGMIRAIYASVYAIVRQVKRCEHNDTVAVKLLFDFFGEMGDSFYQVRLVAFQQGSCFAVRQSLAKSGFFDQLFYECAVVFVTPCIFKSFQNLFMMNEFFCLG